MTAQCCGCWPCRASALRDALMRVRQQLAEKAQPVYCPTFTVGARDTSEWVRWYGPRRGVQRFPNPSLRQERGILVEEKTWARPGYYIPPPRRRRS